MKPEWKWNQEKSHHVDGVYWSNAVDIHGCFNHRRPHWNITEEILYWQRLHQLFVSCCPKRWCLPHRVSYNKEFYIIFLQFLSPESFISSWSYYVSYKVAINNLPLPLNHQLHDPRITNISFSEVTKRQIETSWRLAVRQLLDTLSSHPGQTKIMNFSITHTRCQHYYYKATCVL